MAIVKVSGYVIAEKLGSGSFADVYKAFRSNDAKDIVAIKCVEKKKLSSTALHNYLVSEIEILKKLNHENIVKLKDFTWDDSFIYIIMEYCSGGSLSNFIHKNKRVPEKLCQRFLQQLVKAMKYLREQNISHFDLKPQNILIASKRLQIVKIADFGLAQVMSENDISTSVKGSPLYMAPEIALKHHYDARADIWSVGVILYECLFGSAPYSSKNLDDLIKKIQNDTPIKIPNLTDITDKCRDFLTRCLERDISKRLDFESFFSHPFVDLEHAPSAESFSKASLHLNAANNFEKNSKYKEAFESYNEALKYLIPLLYIETDAKKRVILKRQISNYVTQMELLKENKFEGKSIQMVEIPSHFYTPLESLESSKNITELLYLAQTTPQMKVSIEIAQSAEFYKHEKNYKLALDKYELALGKLLALLKNEPKGKRRDLLVENINIWMHHAESIKVLENKSDCENCLKEADFEKTCSIQ